MNRRRCLYQVTAWLMVVVMLLYPLGVMANQFGSVGREAQQFGGSIAPSEIGEFDNGEITFPGGEASMSVDDMFPGQQPGQDADRFFPHAKSQSELESAYDSDKQMDQAGEDSRTSLQADMESDSPSIQASAYEVLHGAMNRPRPDFSNDPVLQPSQDVFANIDMISEGFGDCSVEEDYLESSIDAHIPEYERCTRLHKPKGSCTIKHTIEIDTEPTDIVFLVDNSASMDDEIADLRANVANFATLIMQGKSDNLRIGGAAFRERDYTWNNRSLTYNISHFQDWINGVETKGAMTYPHDVVAWAARHFNWRSNVNRVIVLIGNNDVGGSRGNAINARDRYGLQLYYFHNNSDTYNIGHHLADRFHSPTLMKFAQFFTVVTDEWAPRSCIDDAVSTLEEFCTGSYTDYPQDPNQCVTLSGFEVCPGDRIYNKLSDAPIPNVHRLANRVEVSPITCDYAEGRGTCWEDQDGETQCLESTGDVEQCQAFEDDPQCGFISSECLQGAEGSRGTCYVYEETYDCGVDVDVPTVEKQTEYQCGGPIRCMGSECLDINKTQSTDFARATAMMNTAQMMVQDMACTEQDAAQTCKIFAGDDGECKIAVGGVQDCCEKPSGISMKDYLTLVMSVPKVDSAIMSIEGGHLQTVKGAYQVLREPLTSGWETVTKPFSSYIENASGVYDSISGSVSDFATEVLNKFKKQLSEMTGKTLTNAASQAGVEGAKEQAAASFSEQLLGETGASLLGGVMTAYQIYVVTMLVIQLVWKCEEEEFELNAKRELKSCHHVGSYCKTEVLGACVEKREAYCCFNSPLSRIIQEQVRQQLGLDWGSAENPACGGLTVAQIGQVDWDRVNMDEWLALLKQNGLFNGNKALSLESLTGQGSDYNLDGTRIDAGERTLKRFEGVDGDAARREAASQIRMPE